MTDIDIAAIRNNLVNDPLGPADEAAAAAIDELAGLLALVLSEADCWDNDDRCHGCGLKWVNPRPPKDHEPDCKLERARAVLRSLEESK